MDDYDGVGFLDKCRIYGVHMLSTKVASLVDIMHLPYLLLFSKTKDKFSSSLLSSSLSFSLVRFACCSKQNIYLFAGGKDNGDNQSVKTQSLRENENKCHTNEKTLLLSNTTHTRITYNSNGKSSTKGRQANTQARRKECVSLGSGKSTGAGLGSSDVTVQDNCNNNSVNS